MIECKDCYKKNKVVREINGCLICGKKGISVTYDTVLSLTKDYIKNTLNYDNYFLCTTKCCEAAYYSKERIIKQQEIKVPIWYKTNRLKTIICYCRDITLDDILNAVKSIGMDATIDKIVKFYQKENIKTNCLFNMPTGDECDKLFVNAINYAKKINFENEREPKKGEHNV